MISQVYMSTSGQERFRELLLIREALTMESVNVFMKTGRLLCVPDLCEVRGSSTSVNVSAARCGERPGCESSQEQGEGHK
jgi:hypothetical protein